MNFNYVYIIPQQFINRKFQNGGLTWLHFKKGYLLFNKLSSGISYRKIGNIKMTVFKNAPV